MRRHNTTNGNLRSATSSFLLILLLVVMAGGTLGLVHASAAFEKVPSEFCKSTLRCFNAGLWKRRVPHASTKHPLDRFETKCRPGQRSTPPRAHPGGRPQPWADRGELVRTGDRPPLRKLSASSTQSTQNPEPDFRPNQILMFLEGDVNGPWNHHKNESGPSWALSLPNLCVHNINGL